MGYIVLLMYFPFDIMYSPRGNTCTNIHFIKVHANHSIYFISDYMRQAGSGNAGGGPRSGYDELDTTLMPPRPGEHYGRGGSGASPANAGGSTSSGGGVGPGVPQHAPHYPGGGPAGLFRS